MTSKKRPTEIESHKAKVVNASNCYTGYSAAFDTSFGEVIITTSNVTDLHIAAIKLNESGFELDESKVQKVAIFDHNKIEQENKNMKADWYDYDKYDGAPPVDTACEYMLGNSGIWWPCNVEYISDYGVVMSASHLINEQYCKHKGPHAVKFRPLDHDKHTIKAVPMEWGVKSGIDFEFKSGAKWYTDKLSSILNGGYITETYAEYTHCRPRMNHPQFMTVAQFDLIPKDVFNLSWVARVDDTFGNYYIVEFTGLKDGYNFLHDV